MIQNHVYRSRIQYSLDYFKKVPAHKVHMNLFSYDKLRTIGHTQHNCGAVGCLAGWLQTSPRFNRWARKYGYRRKILFGNVEFVGPVDGSSPHDLLKEWLGCSLSFFEGRIDFTVTHKTEAINRLKQLLKEKEIHP